MAEAHASPKESRAQGSEAATHTAVRTGKADTRHSGQARRTGAPTLQLKLLESLAETCVYQGREGPGFAGGLERVQALRSAYPFSKCI